MPGGYDNICHWAPTDNSSLACLSQYNHTLSIVNTQTGAITKSISFPLLGDLVGWSPDGKYAAIMCADNDSGYSLWQIDYPALENFKQLTPTLHPGGNTGWEYDTRWSPDGSALAFRLGTDIYIVDMRTRP